MKKLLFTTILAMAVSVNALAQDIVEDELPAPLVFPKSEINEAETTWESLEHGKFYEVSALAVWNEEKDAYLMDSAPKIREYISINEEVDLLTWLEITEVSLEEITDTTVAKSSEYKTFESVHTADISEQYLDIVGTIRGHHAVNKNWQLSTYFDKNVIYDYNKNQFRVITLEAIDREKLTNGQK